MAAPDAPATIDLLTRIQAGDDAAWTPLVNRCVARLKQTGHGRLRGSARSVADTNDIVQDALVKTIHRLGRFECRHPGALVAYLRRVLCHCAIDEARRSRRRGPVTRLDGDYACGAPSPLQQVLGKEEIRRYRAALRRLKPRDRRLILLRMQRRLTYKQVASRLSLRSADGARMATRRALARLAAALVHP